MRDEDANPTSPLSERILNGFWLAPLIALILTPFIVWALLSLGISLAHARDLDGRHAGSPLKVYRNDDPLLHAGQHDLSLNLSNRR